MPRKSSRKLNLTQAKAVILASIITSVLGGIFLLISSRMPVNVKFEGSSVQTSEAMALTAEAYAPTARARYTQTAIAQMPTFNAYLTSRAQTETAYAPTAVIVYIKTMVASYATQTAVLNPVTFAPGSDVVKITIQCPKAGNFSVIDSNHITLVEISCVGTQTIFLPNGQYTYYYQLDEPNYNVCPQGGCTVDTSPFTSKLLVSSEPLTIFCTDGTRFYGECSHRNP